MAAPVWKDRYNDLWYVGRARTDEKSDLFTLYRRILDHPCKNNDLDMILMLPGTTYYEDHTLCIKEVTKIAKRNNWQRIH